MRVCQAIARRYDKNSLQVCARLIFLIVGEDIILPSFYKIKSISISASHPERAKRIELLGG
jgi:hypothetical protein